MSQIPEQAYTAVTKETGYSIGRADRGFTGYTACPQFGRFDTYDEADKEATRLNTECLGIEDPSDAAKLVLSTMNFERS